MCLGAIGAEKAAENLECPPGVDCRSMAQSFWQSDKVKSGVCREDVTKIYCFETSQEKKTKKR